ncbi:MAG: hypothetical protein HFJ17_00295 [Clostridia bacterium]|nr:hypothetical protein [Clostridia bacterium]
MGKAREKADVTLKHKVEAKVFEVLEDVKFLVYKGELVEIRYRKEGGDLSISCDNKDFSNKADEYTKKALKSGNLKELVSYYKALGVENETRSKIKNYAKEELEAAEEYVKRLQHFYKPKP